MARKTTPKSSSRSETAKGAAAPAPEGHCTLPPVPERRFAPHIAPHRARLIRVSERKWVNGTVLHYHFLDEPARWRGSEDDKQAVRDAFAEWKGLPIGLEFEEVHERERAEIRIGFDRNDGSWSFVGRDAIDLAPDPAERTMNFGWPLTTAYGRDTALHEIGHALGFPHEHQNPKAGIVWDEDAVYTHFAGYPNYWNRDTTYWNILRKLEPAQVEGSTWDPDSIMHYQFEAGLIREPAEYRTEPLIPAPGLSTVDMDEARRFYPEQEPAQLPELRPYEAHRVRVGPGEQIDFVIRPQFSRDYTIQTFGAMDTVLVLFEEIGGEPAYLAGDDDSGYARNARIRQRLFRGRSYIVRMRLYFAEAQGEGALMMY